MPPRCIIVNADELDDTQLYDAALSLLSDERRREAESFVFPKDRKLSAVAGLFFRYIELKYGAKIRTDGNGKPQTDKTGVNFNVSHSGCMVAFAESDTPVGIDVETIGDNMSLADSVMTPEERIEFNGIAESERETMFCRMWTVKESYMKAVGSGLLIPPNSFAVIENGGIRSTGFPQGLNAKELDAPKGYCVSVCSLDSRDAVLETMHCKELMESVKSIS